MPRLLLLFIGLCLIRTDAGGATQPPVRLVIEAFANVLDGSASPPCVVSEQFARGGRIEAWIEIWQAQSLAAGRNEAGAEIRCGKGKSAILQTRSRDSASGPYLAADVSLLALPHGQLGVRAFDVDVFISGRKLRSLGTVPEPRSEALSQKRKLFFNEGGSAFLPLLVADETERSALGLLEALVRFEAKPFIDEGSAYGALLITSDAAAELSLDGGAVATTAADRDLVLSNVLVGDHELLARDKKGRTVRTWARVQQNRRTPVSLSFESNSDSVDPPTLSLAGKNAQGFDEYQRSRDGAVVIRIPAGEFLMGNRKTEREPFEHRVELSEYLIDKNEVTWGQYLKFAAATETPLPPHEPYWGIQKDHPAAFVTWDEARAFCEWAGGRLPTEAEWEKAARGTDGRMYPWGNEEPDPDKGVFRRSWGLIATDPVGAHPNGASPYGLLDTGGNMWEWCSDWYDGGYYEVSPSKDPKGPPSGQARVVRSGSWDSRPSVLSASCRNWGPRGYREGDFGFRCAMNPPH